MAISQANPYRQRRACLLGGSSNSALPLWVTACLCLLSAPVPLSAQQAPVRVSGTLHIVGTDTMKDLMERWIKGFSAFYPGVQIDLIANGALTAAPALTAGRAQLAPLGREFVPSELEAFRKAKGYDPTAVRVALGSYDVSGKTVALAFFVNSDNPLDRLNFQQLDALYCNTRHRGMKQAILRWGQLGVTGPLADQAIHLIGVNYPDGISNFIRLRVCRDGEFRPGIHEEHTGGSVNVLERIVTAVREDPAALGYAGFANLQPGTKIVPVSENGKRYLRGTREEVAAAEYPLTRFIYIYLDRSPGAKLEPAVEAFLRYVDSPAGQALVATDRIFFPLPAAVARRQLAELP